MNSSNKGNRDKGNKDIIHINSQLSSKMIVELMEEYPNLKKITINPSLYKRASKRYLEVLEELGIEVQIKYNYECRANKYSDEKKEEIINLIKEGQTLSQIAEKLNLPIKSVYYLENQIFKDRIKKGKISLKLGRKSNYNDATIKKIKSLAKSGISPKEIYKQEKIPLRTIYYIVHNECMSKLPIAPVSRMLKNAGAQRISASAKNALAEALESKSEELAIKAVNFAHHAGRKTVKREDIRIAYLDNKLGRKSNYNDATIKKIKSLAKSGISPKEIYKQEKIPLRTIYYIVHNECMSKLPIAPVSRMLKNAGAQRISASAKNALAEALESKSEELAIKAVNFAHHAGRKTVKREDIRIAYLDNNKAVKTYSIQSY